MIASSAVKIKKMEAPIMDIFQSNEERAALITHHRELLEAKKQNNPALAGHVVTDISDIKEGAIVFTVLRNRKTDEEIVAEVENYGRDGKAFVYLILYETNTVLSSPDQLCLADARDIDQ